MKTCVISNILFLVLICNLIVLNSSCTFIGLAIGHSIDKKDKDPYEIKPIEIQQIDQGRLLTIHCKDGRTIEGKYRGTSQISQEHFQEQYSAFKDLYPNDLSLPEIGDTMEIYYTQFKTTEKSRFKALETDLIILDQLNMGRTFNLPIASNEIFIYHNKKPFLPNNYIDIPRLTTIQIEETNNIELGIPVNEINIIKAHYRKNAQLTGSLIGLGVDVVIISSLFLYYSLNVYPL
jgi:hypothetical protein